MMLWRLAGGPTGYVRDVTAGVFAALYVPFLAGFAVLLLRAGRRRRPGRGVHRCCTVLSDVGGYAAGVLFGKHPMAPTVSPKKSWEGFAGSALFCAGRRRRRCCRLLLRRRSWWQGVVCRRWPSCVTATLGDLGESMIKRDLGIKDMGTLLPGHGGIMDRLDSLLPAAPVAYLLLSWLVAGRVDLRTAP